MNRFILYVHAVLGVAVSWLYIVNEGVNVYMPAWVRTVVHVVYLVFLVLSIIQMFRMDVPKEQTGKRDRKRGKRKKHRIRSRRKSVFFQRGV